ncbi:DUF2681 domain-containing protein [Pasteurellaceae bacterium USgator11]|nr:DUF2681 domain-containing protein [Pasteurellaceae bacterium USgator41]TNG98697.1 DUF2681 domain-containing protein [Pasteurellaceae bacterium UScroc31]TNH00064.1 DUF2681 domain-containing protein [Pasteurellaceae bacterium USgator11]
MSWLLSGIAIIAVTAIYSVLSLRHANREIERLLQINAQLENEKAVAETQVKNHQVRKNHEETNRTADRTAVIDRLQQQGDLRD